MEKIKERNSNIELLRILSMMMIVGLHYLNGNMGGALQKLTPKYTNFYLAYFFESTFIVGVNCFVIITGYFQINKTYINFSKILKLIIDMLFYSIIFYIIAVILGFMPINFKEIIKVLGPFFFNRRWFVKIYIILYLLSPYINIVLKKLDKKQYKIFLTILILLFSLWPSFLPGAPNDDGGYGIITFIIMYSLGGYIQIFYNKEKYKKPVYFIGYIMCAFLTFVCSIVTYRILGYSRAWGYNFIFNIMGSVFLFLFFLKININSTIINKIAKYTFGVFLIHSDFSLNDIIYKVILHSDKYWYSSLFIVHIFISIIFMYTISTIIDIMNTIFFNHIKKVISPYFQKKFPILSKNIEI